MSYHLPTDPIHLLIHTHHQNLCQVCRRQSRSHSWEFLLQESHHLPNIMTLIIVLAKLFNWLCYSFWGSTRKSFTRRLFGCVPIPWWDVNGGEGKSWGWVKPAGGPSLGGDQSFLGGAIVPSWLHHGMWILLWTEWQTNWKTIPSDAGSNDFNFQSSKMVLKLLSNYSSRVNTLSKP